MKLPKKLGWVYLLGVAVLIAAFLVFRRESFGGYIEEQGKYIDAYTSNGPATYPLAEAVQRCNGMPECLGVTQEPGGTGFSLRARATMGSRAGAVSYRKPANAWAAAGFSITPPAPTAPAAGGVMPYSNLAVYKVGDQVTLNGKTYKMVEAAGAAGYSPERPGDRLWQLVPPAAPPPPPAPPAVPNAGAAAVTGGPAPAPTPGPSALQAPQGSATVMSGSPAPVPGPAAGQAPATIVIPAQTSPGTYLLRQVF